MNRWRWIYLMGLLLVFLSQSRYLIMSGTLGFNGEWFNDADGSDYASHFARVLQGDFRRVSPYTHDFDQWKPMLNRFPAVVMGFPFYAWNHITGLEIPTSLAIVICTFIYGALLFLLLNVLFVRLKVPLYVSFFVTTLFFLAPRSFSYMPVSSWFFDISLQGTSMDRFWNPIFNFSLFLASAILAVLALEAEKGKKWIKYTVASGVLLGLSFYTALFYWSHLALGILLSCILVSSKHKWKVLGVGAVTALVIALPELLSSMASSKIPHFEAALLRNRLGFDNGFIRNLPMKKFVLMLVLSLGLVHFWRREKNKDRKRGMLVLIAFVIAGTICRYSVLLTGKELQAWHWDHTLSIFVFVSCTWVIHLYLSRKQPAWVGLYRAALAAFMLVTFSSMAFHRVNTYTNPEHVTVKKYLQKNDYQEAFAWLKENGHPDDVVIGHQSTQYSIPVRTGQRVWVVTHFQTSFLPYDRVYERFQLIWFFDQVDTRAEFNDTSKVLFNSLGWAPLARSLYADPSFTAFKMRTDSEDELLNQFVRSQRNLKLEDLIARLKGYSVNYLIRGPREKGWGTRPEQVFKLKKVGQFGKVRIDRVLSWRTGR